MWSQGSIPGLCIHCASIRPMWSCLIKKPISKIIKAWKIWPDRRHHFDGQPSCAQKSTEKSLKQHVVQIVIRLLWAIKWLQRDLRETIHIGITFNNEKESPNCQSPFLQPKPSQQEVIMDAHLYSQTREARLRCNSELQAVRMQEVPYKVMIPRMNPPHGGWIQEVLEKETAVEVHQWCRESQIWWFIVGKKPINSSMTSIAIHRKSSYFRFHVPPGWTFNCKGLPIPKAPRYDNQWSSVSPAFLITASWRDPWIHVGNWMLGRYPGIVDAFNKMVS